MAIHVDDYLHIEQIPRTCINEIARKRDPEHGNNKDFDCRRWRKRLGLTVDRDRAVDCLAGYGAWTKEELANWTDEEVAEVILWLACNDFSEFLHWVKENPDKDPSESSYGSDMFYLG